MSKVLDRRIDEIVDVLLALARQDFSRKAPITEARDGIDAIAVGINMLAEELDGEVASRRELEGALQALKETQARLVHTEKLAAVGQLASGVAHEINNPAGWGLLSLTLLKRRLSELRGLFNAGPPALLERGPDILEQLERLAADITEGMERIHTVAGDLRSFSRGDSDEMSQVDLNEVIRSSCNMARPLLAQGARLTLELGDVGPVRGNRSRLGQVVTNLLVNAIQAATQVPEREGRVFITTRREGPMVTLLVEDSGPGVPEHLRDRIFEPFFTTKPAELGTGLGLSLVAEAVERHHGTVRVMRSKLGGACFEVRLPALEGFVTSLRSLDEGANVQVAMAEQRPPRRARVLIVDDETTLLRTYVLALGDQHEVKVAAGGREALDLLAEDHAFDLVLCDLQMPDVDGVSVYEEVERRWPELAPRMVFSTGGAYQQRIRDFIARTPAQVLEKPVRMETLLAVIERRLGPEDGLEH